MPVSDNFIAENDFDWQRLQQHPAFPPPEDPLHDDLLRLACASPYALQQLLRDPELLPALVSLTRFERNESSIIAALQDLVSLDDIKKQFRRYRHRKLVEIIFLDVCRHQPVEQTLRQLSDVADCLIQQAQQKAEQILAERHGQPEDADGKPMQLNIIGMGKLGGGELNFSSDIDLICAFREEGELSGYGKLAHSEFFSRVVRLFKELLHEHTADGFVYRVDLRLRPWGDSGSLALSHSALEQYYQLHGREWEQYAMLKARVICASDEDRAALQAIITPFVYRRYHDYRVFDGLAHLKQQIDQQASQQGKTGNIKIGPGGIREIEFFVQAFQILRGGRNQALQTPSILQAMKVLADQYIVETETIVALRQAWIFLRQLENRLQMFQDLQSHALPDSADTLQRIAAALDFSDPLQLELQLAKWQHAVHEPFSTLFESSRPAPASHMDWEQLDPEQQLQWLQSLGFEQVIGIQQPLTKFYQSRARQFLSDKARSRLDTLLPEILKRLAQRKQPEPLLARLLALLTSIAGRSVYFELLYQNLPLLDKLLDAFDNSAWIASEVTQYPILLESLLFPEPLSERFERDRLQHELALQLNNVAGDAELELDFLRQFKRTQTLVIAQAEIDQQIDAPEASRHLTELAEILLQAVYELSWQQLTKRYGAPGRVNDANPDSPGMAIIGYGKLGGNELHYQSDLDIIFLHDSDANAATGVDQGLEQQQFFSRLAQKIISTLTIPTAAGPLYEVDTRLRPNGAAGLLVSSLDAFARYQRDKSWSWEHQALLRARAVAGKPAVQATFESIRKDVLAQPRDDAQLRRAVRDMRDKIIQAKQPPEGETFNLKHSRGGLTDIEFMVQYRVLLHANKFASLCETTDNIGLLHVLHQHHLITDQQFELCDVIRIYHHYLHTRVLQNESVDMPSSHVQAQIDLVRACWDKTFQTTR